MQKILIVDDDPEIGNMTETVLKSEGYGVFRAYSGTEALMLLNGAKPDLILLDLMLPGVSGEDVLKRTKGIPIIVVSAKTDVDRKVELLLDGAVDYITKPFELKELIARVKVALRTKRSDESEIIGYGDIEEDTYSKTVTVSGREIRLTRTEAALLKVMIKSGGKTVSRSAILDAVFFDTPDCTEDSLKIHISNLRKKLREADGMNHIESVWGIGYKLV